MKRKLLNKIALASVSFLACATCFGVAANIGGVNSIADDAKVTLAGDEWTNVGDYSLTWGSTGAVTNADLYATPVTKTNALGQTLKGVELSSNKTYTQKTSNWYPVNGYAMGYGQYLTLKVNDTIDMSKPVEFLFSPYVISGKGGQANHRFVMALSDTDGEVKPHTTSCATNGFYSSGKYIAWEFLKHQQWANAAAPETQGNGPSWYAVSSEGTAATGYAETYDNIGNAPTKDGVTIANSRIAGGALARAFYGAEYLWADLDSKYTVNSSALIKAKFEFTETQLILTFDHVFEQDLSKKEPNPADKVCEATHNLSVESGVTNTACYFKQTYSLSDLGFTADSELNLYFGYYNVHARYGGQSYGDLPMSLKLYNYNNGDVKDLAVKAGNENVNLKANETLDLANVMDVTYFDGATAPATISFASSDETIAQIVDNKVVPTGTVGGEVTITATVGNKTASFKVTVDVNTVTINGNVVGSGDSFTILEDLYAGSKVLAGYKDKDGVLHAVGETITLTDDIVLEEVELDFTMLYGASIRLDSTASIRFTAVFNPADMAAVEALVGEANVSYGMFLTAGAHNYEINSKDNNFKTGTHTNGYTLYSVVMTGIPASDYETELTAQAYVKITYANGETITIASKLADVKDGDAKASNVRSLADVATAAYNDRKAAQEGDYKNVTEDGDYSPYTQAQLEEIYKYIPSSTEEGV